MRFAIVVALAAVSFSPVERVLFADDAASENGKIEKLIATVAEMKGAKFIRNGKAYDGKEAAKHMRRKWEGGKEHIKTARDFIRLAASKSEQSGQPYLIRFDDGK